MASCSRASAPSARACAALRDAGSTRAVRGGRGPGRPFLGICVGMQMLFEGRDEDPGAGSACCPAGRAGSPTASKVPHMGWNTVEWTGPHPLLDGLPDGTWFYFVHSYAPDVDGDTVGSSEHGRRFAAVVARDNVFATQFHPEKSGDAGLQIYERSSKVVAGR